MERPTYKITLLGDGGVGKTSFVTRHSDGSFVSNYDATLGADVRILSFDTNHGIVTLNMWDCAGQSNFRGAGEEYHRESDGCIVMFDVTSHVSFSNVSKWLEEYRRVAPDSPVVICGNKADQPGRRLSYSQIKRKVRGWNLPYFDLSVKACYNISVPLIALCRSLTGKEDLVFLDVPIDHPM